MHQIAVGIFHQETQDLNITPVQYAILQTVHDQPGCDQRTLARCVALDTSTTASTVERLEARGLVARKVAPEDRRARLLTLTPAGQQLLAETLPRMERAQQLILGPLDEQQRQTFMVLLRKLVSENNELSRAPGESGR
jgi:DNA-binding MarR family transcriptional regulator